MVFRAEALKVFHSCLADLFGRVHKILVRFSGFSGVGKGILRGVEAAWISSVEQVRIRRIRKIREMLPVGVEELS